METRIRQNQLNYLKYVEENERNELMRRIVEEKATIRKDHWTNTTKEFMREINIQQSELITIKKEKLKNKIREWDSRKWQKEVEEKSSLSLYRNWKKEMAEEKIYDNRPSSQILFKARTNNLRLNNRNRHTGGDTKCIFCDWNMEDLNHFILWCPGYEDIRKQTILLQRPYIEKEENIIGQLLFSEQRIQESKELVYQMWIKRENQRKNLMDTTA